MSIHWWLEAHTTMDTRDPPAGAGGTPAFRSAVKWCPFPSSEISVCLPSPPAAAAQQSPGWQQHLLPRPCLCQSSALGCLCQGRSEQNVAPSRNALQGYQTPHKDVGQTNSCSSANWIYTLQSSNLYLSTGKIIMERTRSLHGTARIRSNLPDREVLFLVDIY